jgi:hypothetical protein
MILNVLTGSVSTWPLAQFGCDEAIREAVYFQLRGGLALKIFKIQTWLKLKITGK